MIKTKLFAGIALAATSLSMAAPAFAAETGTATTNVNLELISGGITVTAPATVNFGQMKIGGTIPDQTSDLSVTNLTGSAGFSVTAKLSADMPNLTLSFVDNTGQSKTLSAATAQKVASSTSTTTAPQSVPGKLKLTAGEGTKAQKYSTVVTYTVSNTPA